MPHYVCKSPRLGVSRIQRVKENRNKPSDLNAMYPNFELSGFMLWSVDFVSIFPDFIKKVKLMLNLFVYDSAADIWRRDGEEIRLTMIKMTRIFR